MRSLQSEKNALQSALQAIQQELTAKRKCDSEWDELVAGKKLLQQRVSELETGIQQRNVQLDQQAKTIDQQNQQIQHLRDEQVLAERASVLERAEDQIHAQHLLKSNISLQFELQCGQVRIRGLEDQVRGLSETSQMLAEDMLQVKLTVAGRDQMLLLRGQKYSELATAYRGLSRHAQAIEQSEREDKQADGGGPQSVCTINALAALSVYGTAANTLIDVDAQRNFAGTSAARLHSVANAFRNSEKRKEQAISANWNLKRDLVIERCQRTEYAAVFVLSRLTFTADSLSPLLLNDDAASYSSARTWKVV
ncbi:hypothetical protein ON010_g9324 [Phytophthora cinnamomi]|nr:hypothetical protein ON010_g9324 [Phytophthora cinnamomi]